MPTVGLRELKNRLASYVRQVRAGKVVVVTDRGRVVAELRPPGRVPPGARLDYAVARLADRGLLVPGASNSPDAYPELTPLLHAATSAQLLEAERGVR